MASFGSRKLIPTTVTSHQLAYATRRLIATPSASSSKPPRKSTSAGHSVTLSPPRLDYKYLTQNQNEVARNLIARKSKLSPEALDDIVYLSQEALALENRLSDAKARQHALGEKIRKSRTQTSPPPTTSSTSSPGLTESWEIHRQEAVVLKEAIATLSSDAITLEHRLLELGLQLPNSTHPSVPTGSYESSIVTSSFGPAVGSHDSTGMQARCERDHLDVLTEWGWISFMSGQKTTGSSFPFLIGPAALLEQALIQYSLHKAIERGWKPTLTPDLVKSDVADRCGFSPRDESSQIYVVQPRSTTTMEEDACSTNVLNLTATAEIPLTASFHSIVLPTHQFPNFPNEPIKLVAVGHSFRAEAGSRGSEGRGLYRVHQFTKVELVALTRGSQSCSDDMLDEMVQLQISILTGLGLSCRVLNMSSEELGATAYQKFDIEAWMPGRGQWGEVTSASNCTDFQSRRLGIRFQHLPHESLSRKIDYVHTLNATAAAIPRLIVALVENGLVFPEPSSSLPKKAVALKLPSVLKPFWLGQECEDYESGGKIIWVP